MVELSRRTSERAFGVWRAMCFERTGRRNGHSASGERGCCTSVLKQTKANVCQCVCVCVCIGIPSILDASACMNYAPRSSCWLGWLLCSLPPHPPMETNLTSRLTMTSIGNDAPSSPPPPNPLHPRNNRNIYNLGVSWPLRAPRFEPCSRDRLRRATRTLLPC